MYRTTLYNSLLLLGSLLFCFTLLAQTGNDTLLPYRAFLKSSRAYQQLPLQLDLHLQSRSNFITSPEDSFDTGAQFFIQSGGSYVRYGEVEQLTNDTVAIIVNTAAERMIVYADARPVLERVQGLLGGGVEDSSILKLAAVFKAKLTTAPARSSIELTSRSMLQGTFLPKQEIRMETEPISGNPVRVTTLRRTLVVLSVEEFEEVKSSQPADKLLVIAGKGQYLIKEVVSTFEYKRISHEVTSLPVRIEDRIIRVRGEFQPAKGYENYGVSLN